MPNPTKMILIFLLGQGLPVLTSLIAGAMFGVPFGMNGFLIFGLVFGLIFASEMCGFTIYNLGSWTGWLELVLDTTWSFPNTVFGWLVSHALFFFWGTPDREKSLDQGWMCFMPRQPIRFLQTIGPYNLGGPGKAEALRARFARILGPLYLPIYLFDFALNFVIQILWIFPLRYVFFILGVRSNHAYLEPPPGYRLEGFWGWILYATLFETWIGEEEGISTP